MGAAVAEGIRRHDIVADCDFTTRHRLSARKAGCAARRSRRGQHDDDRRRHAHERCEGFSRGMRQKVALAGALVHDPKLIILDEPLTGLDAGTARQVKDVLRGRVREGGTVIMCKICYQLRYIVPKKSIVVVTRYTAQK